VTRWAGERGLQARLRGTMLSHIEVPSMFRAAVESFAGMALFNVLAMDDEVAAEAVKFVRTKRLGAIVVTPLSQIETRHYEYPKMEGVKALVDVIKCPDWARPAVQQVFGKVVVCRTMELCEQVARSHGLDAITLDGDRVSRVGVVAGGYQDPQRFTRLPLAQDVRVAQEKAKEAERQLPRLEETINQASSELDELHAERRQGQELRDRVRSTMQSLTEQVQSSEAKSSKANRDLGELREWRHRMEVLIQQCDASVEAKKMERASKSLKGLSKEEQNQLEVLTSELKAVDAEQEGIKATCVEAHARLEEREAQLEGHLRKRLHALELEAVGVSQEDVLERADRAAQVCAVLEREHRETSDGALAAAQELQSLAHACEAAKQRLEECATRERGLQDEAAAGSLRVDKIDAEVLAQTQRRSEIDHRLSGLAAPTADVERGRQMPKAELVREMAEVSKQLQAFQHVNRKAVEQYENFAEQLRDLETRLAEVDGGEKSIQDALNKIDAQKEATILQTLNRVNEHFQDVFAEMVPGGKGQLQIIRQEPTAESSAQEGDLLGVRIEVSFTGQAQSYLLMNQLSGGQKTVVALTLVFAIQRLEPAPFYLLDEVDAALDASYRSALANLIARTAAGGSQVIQTTFRLEALDKANRCYRVYQQNRASRIDAVTAEQAKQVLREQDRLAQAATAAGAIQGP